MMGMARRQPRLRISGSSCRARSTRPVTGQRPRYMWFVVKRARMRAKFDRKAGSLLVFSFLEADDERPNGNFFKVNTNGKTELTNIKRQAQDLAEQIDVRQRKEVSRLTY